MNEESLAIAFVGDAVGAAGFALAGVATHEALPGAEQDALARARASAQVVLVDARCAARIPDVVLERALAAVAPVTMIVPGHGAPLAMDPVERTRRLLGFEP